MDTRLRFCCGVLASMLIGLLSWRWGFYSILGNEADTLFVVLGLGTSVLGTVLMLLCSTSSKLLNFLWGFGLAALVVLTPFVVFFATDSWIVPMFLIG